MYAPPDVGGALECPLKSPGGLAWKRTPVILEYSKSGNQKPEAEK